MPFELPFGVRVLNPKPADDKYLNDGIPYVDIAEVNSLISEGIRHTGLTVNIQGVEYWYRDGVTDTDLIVKITDSGGNDEYTGATPSDIQVGHMQAGTTLTGRTYTSLFQEIFFPF